MTFWWSDICSGDSCSGGISWNLSSDNLSFTDYYHGNSPWQCFIANQNQECHFICQWMTNCQWWQVSWNAPQVMISQTTKRVRIMIGFLVRGRVRIKIRFRVRVGVTLNVTIYHRSNCGQSKCCTCTLDFSSTFVFSLVHIPFQTTPPPPQINKNYFNEFLWYSMTAGVTGWDVRRMRCPTGMGDCAVSHRAGALRNKAHTHRRACCACISSALFRQPGHLIRRTSHPVTPVTHIW